ncbi:unnamed protein product, partial [Rotaria sp. Silwood1]
TKDVGSHSPLVQFDTLFAYLDDKCPEKLLVYRLQKRYNDIARCMQITAELQTISIPLDQSPSMTNLMSTTIDYVPTLDADNDD